MKHRLNEKWIKASIAGTIWAASEIVLGSFLHNLKVPFSGNILTAIGLIILISISYIWTERGLFWRAGVICALMKAMSPSAVIFGPMIAIFTEAFLLELFVRLLGRTIAGYMIGAMLAMSWNLVQKILNYIIFYGSDIIEVYTDLLKYAQKQLDIKTDIVWLPLIILLGVYALFGLFAAATGIRVGRKMLNEPVSGLRETFNQVPAGNTARNTQVFDYSITWLFVNITLIISSFIMMNLVPWYAWCLAITGIVIVWSFRYQRALRQISKPKFWILFVVITLITAFVFTKARPGENSLLNGLLTGIQMNFRAIIIITGFSVLGTELYNPVVRNFFLKTSFKNLPLALELSAESLPLFISSIPDLRTLRKNPVSIFHRVISHAETRLADIKGKETSGREIFLITGSVGGGKTSFLKKLIEILERNDIKADGILSDRIMKGRATTGYDLLNIETGERFEFLNEAEGKGDIRIGRFTISSKGLQSGQKILDSLISRDCAIIIIDEVGLLELHEHGWYQAICNLLEGSSAHILMTVRDLYAEDVKKKWNITGAVVINISETEHSDAALMILDKVRNKV